MVFLSEKLAQNGGYCPVCGKFFRPNGVGPQDDRMLSSMLSLLPSSHILKFGANYHDWAYHLGPAWGCRSDADRMMFVLNDREIMRKCTWYNAWYYRLMNHRNFVFVEKFGGNYWDKDGCKLHGTP